MLIKTPTKGMNDYLPSEAALRQYVKNVIIDEYSKAGFSLIETPAVEHIENLTGKNGGDNEKLIFKIMKRGEELARAEENGEDLCDSGLRYDLTLPLARYFAKNSAKLPQPFLAMQIGNVWRADRPQKGRFRQFTQCDIDILGDASEVAEITLISSTAGVLNRLGFSGFTVRINDRRLLRLTALGCGLPESEFDNIFIILDKMDKIGIEGVKNELLESGYDAAAVEKYITVYTGCEDADLFEFASASGDEGIKVAEGLSKIMKTASAVAPGGCSIKFDPTLVRGMSYYTGTIFEIKMDGYGYSVGGGGRYDEMIGLFCGVRTPACGFSLGFERIVGALADSGFVVPSQGEKTAFLADRDLPEDVLLKMYSDASALRAAGGTVAICGRMKNTSFQIDRLKAEGFSSFRIYGRDSVKVI